MIVRESEKAGMTDRGSSDKAHNFYLKLKEKFPQNKWLLYVSTTNGEYLKHALATGNMRWIECVIKNGDILQKSILLSHDCYSRNIIHYGAICGNWQMIQKGIDAANEHIKRIIQLNNKKVMKKKNLCFFFAKI